MTTQTKASFESTEVTHSHCAASLEKHIDEKNKTIDSLISSMRAKDDQHRETCNALSRGLQTLLTERHAHLERLTADRESIAILSEKITALNKKLDELTLENTSLKEALGISEHI